MVFKLYRFFKKNNFDCVILNLPSDAKTVGFAAKLAKVPKVIYRRGMPHPIRASLINNITYKNFITHIIANSQIVKESIFYNIKSLEDKIQIIYNGVESPNGKVPNTYSSPTSSFPTILGNVGRPVKQKGQQYLIDLAIELKKENFPFKIYIAGKGPLEEELKRKIKQFRLTETVILEGHVKSEELFNKIDIFVFTSEFEGLSNALIESLSYQKPVICFDTSSNAEIVEDGQSGNIIPAYDIIKMKEAIIALANDPEKYQRYQKNGLKAVQTKFNHQEKMNELYQLVKS